MIIDAITPLSSAIRLDMYYNIILSGGNTLLGGFKERLHADILSIVYKNDENNQRRIKICAPPERRLHTWIGGSILASLSSFQDVWISKSEYDEHGPTQMVLKHCQRGH